jgi:predicted nucleic acid-binding protein
MSVTDFFDSNVLVYAFDTRDQRRNAIADALLVQAQREHSAIISYQVVQETLNVLTRKLTPRLTAAEARDILLDVLAPLWRIHPSSALYSRALSIQERYGYSFYDSLVIAAALEGGCARLLSEDLQHGQQIEGLTIKNPFTD